MQTTNQIAQIASKPSINYGATEEEKYFFFW